MLSIEPSVLIKLLGKPVMNINIESKIRVATAQGKQGIWLLTFPDRENTEFSKFNFFLRENCGNTGKILNFLKILLLKWQQCDGAFLS